jgi:hypothetical protein
VTDQPYSPPVDKLLTQGDKDLRGGDWLDYRSLGLTDADIPELIRMALDEQLIQSDDDGEAYAAIHAWRALGQFKAVAAVEPLLIHFTYAEDFDKWWDWATEELPTVYGMIGAPAIPALSTYLVANQKSKYAASYAAESLREIGMANSEVKEECVGIIQRALENFADNDEGLNAFLIGDLIKLEAVEAAPLMQRAFEADAVDESVYGDWEEVQVDLGLKAQRDPKPTNPFMSRILANIESRAHFDEELNKTTRAERPKGKAVQKKEKNKRKQAKKTRKANRRK